jgi:protein-tyrosine phosphatase
LSSFAEVNLPLTNSGRNGAASLPRRVLFLCTGNYYRSRFAEIFFNHHAEKLGLPWRAASRGLALERGVKNVGPLSADTVARLRELGIPHEGYLHDPRPVGTEDLTGADLVVAVKEAEHRPLLCERFPAWVECVEYWHVHDVDGATPADALLCLERALVALLTRLSAEVS